MKKFTKGFLTGVSIAAATVAGVAFGFKKTVIEPIEKKEATIDENRKKAMRKSHAR